MRAATIRFFIIGALLALVLGLFFWGNGGTSEETPPAVHVNGQTVHIALADTPETRSRGLSGRSELSFDEGMLFVFPEDGAYGFWMKDMQIPIDIIWMSQAGVVVDMALNVSPDTYPASFFPKTPARYVLEVAAGFAERYSVRIGDTVEL